MKKVLILGGTGFVGRHVCEQLNRAGIAITVPTRRRIHAQSIQTLPLVEVIEADVHDEQSLTQLLPGHDAVVNLVAILHGTPGRFHHVHVELPQKLARAMKATGVKRFVHVSALGVADNGASNYQRSKAAGESVLQQAALDLTILRPSVIFGAQDRFLNLFARLQAVLPFVPLAGAATRFQPVWVGDVAQAIVRCLKQAETTGTTFECAGPDVMSLGDLVKLAGRLSGHPRPVFPIPMALGYLQAWFMALLPGEPPMSVDNLKSMQTDNVSSGALPGLSDLGITPSAVEPVAALYLDLDNQADPLLQIRRNATRS